MSAYHVWAVVHDRTSGKPAHIPGARAMGYPRQALDRPRVMVRIATRQTYDAAVAAWQIANNRRLAGLTPEVDYLVVRDAADLDWQKRYPNLPLFQDRLAALLVEAGDVVRVRIYGNTYAGRVVRAGLKTAEVSFRTNTDRRTRTFPILPADTFARGVHALIRKETN